MISKKILKYAAVLSVIAILLVPKVAQAWTIDELQDTVDKAYRLCASDAERFANSCKAAEEINNVKVEAASKPKSQQAAYIDQKLPKFSSTRTAVDKNYLKAVADGRINEDGSIKAGSSYTGADNCGGVDVSVDVGCSGKGNPIYDYLRGIIIFIGGAIGLAVVISIILAGIQYSASNGNPQNIAKAKERIVNAVIGLVLYLFLAAILRYLIPQVFS